MMTPNRLTACATAAACALIAASSAHAGFLADVADTLPGGFSEENGFFSAQYDGFTRVMNEGTTSLVLPIYTNHPHWAYDNRHEENGYPYGGGIARSVIDERGNERMVYAIAFSDSHYSIEPFLGYAWLSRWNLANDFHVGAGYLLGLTFREDYYWYPIPAPLPLVGAGYKNVDFYCTYIPFSNVFFFFSKIQTDDRESRTIPLEATGSHFKSRTELYAAWMWEHTDSATDEKGFMVTSDDGGLAGLRHFLTDHWAVDLEASRAKHDTHGTGYETNEWKLTSLSANVQYHFYPSDSWRFHAGAGVGYSTLKNTKTGKKAHSVFPTVQTGVTWAPTDHTRVMGGMNLHFQRFHDVGERDDDVAFQPAPVQFYLGAGIAF